LIGKRHLLHGEPCTSGRMHGTTKGCRAAGEPTVATPLALRSRLIRPFLTR
jgi:hypothetical protein